MKAIEGTAIVLMLYAATACDKKETCTAGDRRECPCAEGFLGEQGCTQSGQWESCSCSLRLLTYHHGGPEVDVLFLVDSSGSMAGEQRQLCEAVGLFADTLDSDYRFAVVTPGVPSDSCPPCPAPPEPQNSCINVTGENGRFQDRKGKNVGTDDNPEFQFDRMDPTCRVITEANRSSCFYDEVEKKGTVLVGTSGCGYERGLAAIGQALHPDLLGTWNQGFLRPEATLLVIVVSDEEDCGEVGDVTENVPNIGGDICYYAAKGVGPQGETSDPREGRPYRLTDVQEVYDFLMGVKGSREGMVKFAAIVGIADTNDPDATSIEYVPDPDVPDRMKVAFACDTLAQGCTGNYCHAYPGTRYIQLARMFEEHGGNGFLASICQMDFSSTLTGIAGMLACPETFPLALSVSDPDKVRVLVNGQELPRYSCAGATELVACAGPEDTSCGPGAGECLETWTIDGMTLAFAEHYHPCRLVEQGGSLELNVLWSP